MTTEDLKELFDKYHDEEYLKFENVVNKKTSCHDLQAFLILDSLVPGGYSIHSGATHDEIWLSADVDKLAKVISEEQIIDLIRCGVMHNGDGLSMFA